MLAIFKREFKSYFQTLIAPIAIFILLLLGFLFFQVYNLVSGYNNISNMLYSLCLYGMTFALPILSMRVFADEKRTKSDQLILTAPVSIGKIVLGKFLALSAVFAIPMALFCILPPVMSLYGNVPLKWNYVSIVTIFLYGLMIIAISMFMSSMTETPAIAAVLAIIVTFLGMIMSTIYKNIKIEWLSKALSAVYDFGSRLTTLLNGTLDWTAIVYFISVIALFLFLCTQSIQKRRFSFSKDTLSVSAYSFVTTIVCILVIVFVNLASNQIPERFKTIDITSNHLYSLTKDSKDFVKSINDDIKIYILSEKDTDNGYVSVVAKNIENYASLNKKISYEYVSTVTNPTFATKYTSDKLSDGSVIVENTTKNRSRVIDFYSFFKLDMDYQTYQQYITGYDIEGKLTEALQYVNLSEDSLNKAYSLTGHNEASLDDSFTDLLTKNYLSMTDLNLMTSEKVPDDCKVLFINAPKNDLNDDEVLKIEAYIKKGGNILFVSSISGTGLTNFDKVLDMYSVSIADNLAIENDSQHYYNGQFGTSQIYLIPEMGSSDIVSGFGDANNMVIAPICQPINYEKKDGLTFTELLTTSDKASLGKVNGNQVQLVDNTQKKLVVGLEAEKKISDKVSSKCIVYSSENMFTKDADKLVNGTNQRLFSNTVNALSNGEFSFVSIPVKEVSNTITLPVSTVRLISTVWIVIIFAVIICGIVTWVRRRHM